MSNKRYAVVSCLNDDIVNALARYGFRPVKVKPYRGQIGNPESTHADMQILTVNNTVVLLRNNTEFNSRVLPLLNDKRVVYTEKEISEFKYPDCIKLNVLIVGNNAVLNLAHADRNVIQTLDGYDLINVNQGYAKCCCAVVDDHSIITSDESICKAASDNNIDCLKITSGFIELCDKYYGFIGGCSFKSDNDTLVFTGDITAHPDFDRIHNFCRERCVRIHSLIDKPLYDVGGIIII